MFLKSLDIIGFKSFAEKARFEFPPGMTAIVGPNGCGKSNVADAVRWVLGEQSAKALRGGSMQDVIFNGTDQHKPLGMAEVSLTMAECEQALGTEYNEVTITRRVHRSGEGQYFINRTPCRLKDIQRLFMDTGMGATSYSVLEQGRIDLILSSRPEDRRGVFEEASGITKFKADKKEALRKLGHTEANLLRLADIIAEVKRQIISLQRQAGKARRYQALREKLRDYDLFVTRRKLQALDDSLQALRSRVGDLAAEADRRHRELEESERAADLIRDELAAMERRISEAVDAAAQTRSELERTEQMLAMNGERLNELRTLAERDQRDTEDGARRVEVLRASCADIEAGLAEARGRQEKAEAAVREHNDAYAEAEEGVARTRGRLQALRGEAIDIESRCAALQNEMADMEARERGEALRRERLRAEQRELNQALARYREQQEQSQAQHLEQAGQEARAREVLDERLRKREGLDQRANELRNRLAALKAEEAGKQAQKDMLNRESGDGEFPGGARLLLDLAGEGGIEEGVIQGKLADFLRAKPPYALALEAALRAYQDALVVRDEKALSDLLNLAVQRKAGPVRLVAAGEAQAETHPGAPGEPLLAHVLCDPVTRGAVNRLLCGVRLVEHMEEAKPIPGLVFVTPEGVVWHSEGMAEFWSMESPSAHPVSRRHRLDELEASAHDLREKGRVLEEEWKQTQAVLKDLAGTIEEARGRVEVSKRNLALLEGEKRVLDQQAGQAEQRADTVAWEIGELDREEGSGGDRGAEMVAELDRMHQRQAVVREEIQQQTGVLHEGEARLAELLKNLSDSRMHAAECRQEAEHLSARLPTLQDQIGDIQKTIRERTDGVAAYELRIGEIEGLLAHARERLDPLRAELAERKKQQADARADRTAKHEEASALGEQVRARRAALEEIQERKTKLDVQLAEQRVRRQHLLERAAAEYHVTEAQVREGKEPEWEDGTRPSSEAIETAVAEMRARIESMGPINLVAIEEHKELEERYAFLCQQQEDLQQAKQQLLDMIKKIDITTTGLFSDTFRDVNTHFQDLFKQLFGGGSAKLVLVDEEDVLESGIEIIARPPGKKLQTISLLSGGERTLAAVALLFALYRVKPSPFCVLDELDAALDESNIGRFVGMLQGFLKDSQFIVITHNRLTIAAADVLYGVTMQQPGLSHIVSVRFADHEQEEKPQAGVPVTGR